jgi:hypothetical protein
VLFRERVLDWTNIEALARDLGKSRIDYVSVD